MRLQTFLEKKRQESTESVDSMERTVREDEIKRQESCSNEVHSDFRLTSNKVPYSNSSVFKDMHIVFPKYNDVSQSVFNSSETFLKPEDNPEVSTNEQVLAPEDEMMRQESRLGTPIDLRWLLKPGGLSKSSPNVKSSFTTENGHSEESDKWCRENLD